MSKPYIVGWGYTRFGKLDTVALEQLIRDAALSAMASAGLEPKDIDGIFVGHFKRGSLGKTSVRPWRPSLYLSFGIRHQCASKMPAWLESLR